MSMTQPRVPEDVSAQVDWLQRERGLDPIAIREREYKGNLHEWVWELWSRSVICLIRSLMEGVVFLWNLRLM